MRLDSITMVNITVYTLRFKGYVDTIQSGSWKHFTKAELLFEQLKNIHFQETFSCSKAFSVFLYCRW